MKKEQLYVISKNLFILIGLLVYGFSAHAQDVDGEEPIYTIVDNMPTFKGCEKEMNEKAKLACTSESLMRFIQGIIEYPVAAKEAGVEGTVYVSYVVDPQGKVGHLNIDRGIDGGNLLNEEALRVVRSLPDFNPGKHNGEAVRVRYVLPVNFKLS